MDIQQILIVAGALVLMYFLFKITKGIITKIIGLLFIVAAGIGVMLYLGVGPFSAESMDLRKLEKQHCKGETMDTIKCYCVIRPVKNDIFERFTKNEYEEMINSPMQMSYAIYKSIDKQQKAIKSCLEENGKKGNYKEILKEVFQSAMTNVSWENMQSNAKEWLQELNISQKKAEEVDKKYNE